MQGELCSFRNVEHEIGRKKLPGELCFITIAQSLSIISDRGVECQRDNLRIRKIRMLLGTSNGHPHSWISLKALKTMIYI